jgi:hypothetical protein
MMVKAVIRCLLLILFLITMASGCTSSWSRPEFINNDPVTSTILVCVDLPGEHWEPAKSAVDEWNVALGDWRRVVAILGTNDGFVDGCSIVVSEVEGPNPDSPNALAWVSALGGREISMMRGRYEYDVRGILLHELGHAFGAQHVYGTLMNRYYDKSNYACPDVETVAQVAAWNRVNLARLRWCY